MPIEKIYLELTNRCNLNCIMCYRNSWNFTTEDMEKEVLQKCINEIKEMPSIKEVILGGIGEPTFFSEVQSVMRALKDKHITLTTNGTIMYPSMLETIVECIDHVVLSIDGVDDVFHSIRRYPLDKIMENINQMNRLKKLKGSRTPMLSIQMVLSKANWDQIYGVVDIARELEASKVILSNVLPTDLKDRESILYKLYDNNLEGKELFKGVQNYALRKGMEIKLPAYRLKTERRCRFIDDNTCVVTTSGEVAPCYRLSHDGTEVVFGRLKEIKAHSFGNIRNSSLIHIWESQHYVNYRNMVYNNHYPSCPDCDLVEGCDMARSSSYDCYGNSPSCSDCLWSRNIVYCI